jgi:hypothetical protein
VQGIMRPAFIARLVVGGCAVLDRGVVLRRKIARSWVAPDGTERLTLGALDLSWIGAPAALQVEVLSDCVVKKTHAAKATRR